MSRPLRSARSLLRLPDGKARWRRIAAWLGFDGSRSFVDLLRRCTRSREWSVEDFVALRGVWADPLGRKRLRHARKVDADVVQLLAMAIVRGQLDRVHVGLIDAAFAGGAWGGVATRFDAACEAWPVLRPGRPLPLWRTAEALEADLEALRREVDAARSPGLDDPFPPPPLLDDDCIRALDSPEVLAAEGAAMIHCLANGSWESEARRRRGYGYAVKVGEDRASLWIARDVTEPAGFRVSELRGVRNAPAAPAVVQAVVRWLSRATGPLPEVWNAPLRRGIEGLTGPFWYVRDEEIPF